MSLSNKNIIKIVCLVVLILIALTVNINAESGVIQWRLFASYPPVTLPYLPMYKDMVNDATNGQLEIQLFYPGEHPFAVGEILSAIRDKRCQIAEIEGAYFAGTEPVLALTGTPMVIGTAESMYAMQEALLKEGVLQKVYDKYNAMHLACGTWYSPSISSSKSLINDENSLKGQKIRVPTKQHADATTWLGGSPVTISWNEVYTALQRGVVDGAMGSLEGQVASKFHEVAPYITILGEAIGMDSIIVNKDAFNDLPEDVQAGFLEATKEWEKIERERRANEAARIVLKSIHEEGIIVRALPEKMKKILNEKSPAYTMEWAEKAGKGSIEAYNVIKVVLGW